MRLVSRLSAFRRSPAAALAVVTAATFLDALLYGLVVPILPAYSAALGASQAAIGVLFGAYAAGLILATPPFGILSDRIGRRATMLWGLIGLAAATAAFAFAQSFAALLLARILQGVAAAATWTAGLALMTDLHAGEARGRALGIAMSGSAAGVLLGPPLGGLLYEAGGYTLPFLIVAALVLLDGAGRALIAEPPRRAAQPVGVRRLMRDRGVRVALGALTLQAAALAFLEPTLPLHLERTFAAAPTAVGLLLSVAVLGYGLAAPAAGGLAGRWGGIATMRAGLIVLAAALPLLAWPAAIALEAAVLLAVGIGCGLIVPPAYASVADRVDRLHGADYATVYAILNVGQSLGMMAGPVAGGMLTGSVGFAGALAVMALVLLAYAPLLGARREAVRPPP